MTMEKVPLAEEYRTETVQRVEDDDDDDGKKTRQQNGERFSLPLAIAVTTVATANGHNTEKNSMIRAVV